MDSFVLPNLNQQYWPWLQKPNRQRFKTWGRLRSWSILLPPRMKPNTRGCFGHDEYFWFRFSKSSFARRRRRPSWFRQNGTGWGALQVSPRYIRHLRDYE